MGSNYEREPLDEFEEVRGVFYGNMGAVGQQFVVTNRRLLLAPIRLIKGLSDRVALEVAGYVAGTLNVPGASLVQSILQDYGPFSPRTIWLRHIANVTPGSNGGWFGAPTLILTTDTDDTETLHVLRKGLWTLNADPRNIGERDRMVQVLRQAVTDAKATPAPPTLT